MQRGRADQSQTPGGSRTFCATTPPITPLADEVDAELAEFTAEFLDAMLVGSHRLSRYTVAGSDIRTIEPFPYQTVALSELATGVVDGRTYVVGEASVQALEAR